MNSTTTTFIANQNASFLSCLFAYHVDVPGYGLRVTGYEVVKGLFPINTPHHVTRNPQQYRMTQKEGALL